nr:hypothetical protein CFP56_44993 [Quercus suber]
MSGSNDVEQRDNFYEIQETIVIVAVQTTKNVGINPIVVAGLPQELDELVVADLSSPSVSSEWKNISTSQRWTESR